MFLERHFCYVDFILGVGMKKIIKYFTAISFSLAIAIFSPLNVFAAESNPEENVEIENENSSKDWAEIGNQGKKALSEAGKFFSEAGKKALDDTGKAISDIYKDMKTPRCYGKWIYKNGKSQTIIECKENKTMSVIQKSNSKTKKWSGVFTATAHTITFVIVKENGKTPEPSATWFFTYSLQEGGESIKFQSMNLPEDADGTSFKTSVLFTKFRIFA